MFKDNNKNIRTTSWRRSVVFIDNFEYVSHSFFSVSIVAFERANVN